MSVNQGKNEPSLNHIPISRSPRERTTSTARDRLCHNVGGGFDSGSPCAPRSLAHPYLPSPHPSFLGLTHLTAAAATPFEIIGNFLGDSKTTKAFKSIAGKRRCGDSIRPEGGGRHFVTWNCGLKLK